MVRWPLPMPLSEHMMAFRGEGSKTLRRRYYGGESGRPLQALGEHCSYRVHDTGEYKHLGGYLHVCVVT